MDSNPNLIPNPALLTPNLSSEADSALNENREPALSFASSCSSLEVETDTEANINKVEEGSEEA